MSNSPAKSMANSGDEFTTALNLTKIPMTNMDTQSNYQEDRPCLPSKPATEAEAEVKAINNKVIKSWNVTVNAITHVRILQRHHDQLCDQQAEVSKKALRTEMERALNLPKPAYAP